MDFLHILDQCAAIQQQRIKNPLAIKIKAKREVLMMPTSSKCLARTSISSWKTLNGTLSH